MIKSVEIENFQSHKKSVFEFHPNVNIISGSSNNGKSVVIRALNWVLRNKTIGNICSDWNTDKNGNPINNIKVKVVTDKGECIRIKGKKNGYVLNGVEYNAIGRDVPDQVKDFFNLTETNIQSQMDAPFLLSLNGPDATKFVNKVVKLDCIDTILSKAEKERRSINSEITVVQKDLEKCKTDIEKLNWVEKAEALQVKIDAYENQINSSKEEYDSFKSTIDLFKEKEKFIVKNDFQSIIDEIDEESKLLREMVARREILSDSVCKFKNTKTYNTDQIDSYIKDIELLSSSIINDKNNSIRSSITSYKTQVAIREELDKEIKELESQFPEVCPLCGSRIHNA